MILKDSIVIKASSEEIYNYLVQRMTDLKSYKEWHKEHVDLKWLKGEGENIKKALEMPPRKCMGLKGVSCWLDNNP